MRNVPTRIQLYIRAKAKLNIGTHCGFLDCVSRYSKVFQIQRVFPLNHNSVEAEYYINKSNYKKKLEKFVEEETCSRNVAAMAAYVSKKENIKNIYPFCKIH